MRSNKVLHVEVRFEDGEVIVDKFRDSVGGYINLINRINAAAGGPNHGVGRVRLDAPLAGQGSVMGRRFEIVAVER